MAIHAKRSGLMVGGQVISETDDYWVFKASDNKRSQKVSKFDTSATIFDGDYELEEVEEWIRKARGE